MFLSMLLTCTVKHGSELVKDLPFEYAFNMFFLVETPGGADKASIFAKRSGFDSHVSIDAQGQAGGIWCFWKSHSWSVQVISSTSQTLYLSVSSKKGLLGL